MSTRYDDIWKIGETWSVIVTCTDEDGDNLNPVSVDWKLKTLDGLTTVFALSGSSGIVVAGNVATITIATVDQVSVNPGTYRHRLKVTDSGGAISRQMHGLIKVRSDDS